MTQNSFMHTIFNLRLGVICLCILFVIPAHASRRHRMRQNKQVAMLAEDAEQLLTQQLGTQQEDTIDDTSMTSGTPASFTNISDILTNEDMQSDNEHEVELEDTEDAYVEGTEESDAPFDKIELYFQDASLENFADQIKDIFDVSFIMDDDLDPLPQNGKSLKGTKISYRTITPISRKEAWNTFNTFLNIALFALVPHTNERTYRITAINTAQKLPLPTYIGVDATTLPDSNELIRYVYFIENTTIEAINAVIEPFRSSSSTALYLKDHKAFILTDISYNIKKLMEIVKELDKVSMPESLSVLKLRRADAKEVKDLYDTLTQKKTEPPFGPLNKRTPEGLALPENITVIAEPRTNSLILLGPQQARERLEQFIIKNVDVELDQAYSPLHTYQLRYATAETIAKIMNEVTKFGQGTEAGKSGGVRGGDQYMRPISFIAEPATNRLVIKGHYDDYLKAVEVIKALDVDQPQVAIEILILSIDITKTKQLGAQIRSKTFGGTDGLVGPNVKFQTSGLFAQGATAPAPIQQNYNATAPGVQRLLGNLLNLVVGAPAGNTIITLGEDINGVWGIMQMLETVSNVQLVSNPFLIATNNSQATVELGQTRRVTTAQALAASGTQQNVTAIGEDSANLQVIVTPHINSDGMIILDLDITIDNFTTTIVSDPTKNTRNFKTSATLANKQILALGGLIRNTINTTLSKTPWLGDIPILGWLFKNKSKQEEKENLLILVSTRLVEPKDLIDLDIYNKKHTDEYGHSIGELISLSETRDPIHNVFFKEQPTDTDILLDHFLFERKKPGGSSRIRRLKKEQAREALAQQEKQTPSMQGGNAQATKIAAASPSAQQKHAAKPATQRMQTAQSKTSAPQQSIQKQAAATHTNGKPPQPIATQPAVAATEPQAHDIKSILRTKKRTNLALTDMLATNKQGALT